VPRSRLLLLEESDLLDVAKLNSTTQKTFWMARDKRQLTSMYYKQDK